MKDIQLVSPRRRVAALRPGNQNQLVRPVMSREASLQRLARKEAELRAAMQTRSGLSKIAANLSSPVRQKLDYQGIGRKFGIVEPWPDGMPMIYDTDVEEFTAVKIARNGTTTMIEVQVSRT